MTCYTVIFRHSILIFSGSTLILNHDSSYPDKIGSTSGWTLPQTCPVNLKCAPLLQQEYTFLQNEAHQLAAPFFNRTPQNCVGGKTPIPPVPKPMHCLRYMQAAVKYWRGVLLVHVRYPWAMTAVTSGIVESKRSFDHRIDRVR